MSDWDDLAATVNFDIPDAAAAKGPRSALRMRNGRKQLPQRAAFPLSARMSKKPVTVTLAKINLPDIPAE